MSNMFPISASSTCRVGHKLIGVQSDDLLISDGIGNLKRENPKSELSEERLFPLFAFMGDTTAIQN